MANQQLAAVAGTVVSGAGIEPCVSYDIDVIAQNLAGLAAGDVILTPIYDLRAIMPQCNRAVIIKDSSSANADVVRLRGSNDGVVFHDLPQYNSNAGCNVSTAAGYVTTPGLPMFRYIQGQMTVVTSVPVSLRLCIGFMRY